MTPRLRLVLRVLLVLGLLFMAVAVRVVTSALAELDAGEHFRAGGDLDRAVLHYRRAARWYLPGAPFQAQALEQLGAIGVQAEHRGDNELALSAYRAIAGAIMSTRSFYLPEAARLHEAHVQIARLMAAQPRPQIDAQKSRAQIEREQLALLQADLDPNLSWTLLLLCGFGLWVSSAVAFCMRAIGADNQLIPREARRWGSLIALGLGMFVLGLALA